jgi:HEAT repeat protein
VSAEKVRREPPDGEDRTGKAVRCGGIRVVPLFLLLFLLIAELFGAPGEARLPGPAVTKAEIRKLIEQLGHKDYKKRESAQKRLIRIGADVLPVLRRAEENEDPEVRQRVKDIISIIRWGVDSYRRETIRKWILEPQRSDFWKRREQFVRLGDSAVQVLQDCLRDDKRKVRERAIEALGWIGGPEVVTSLLLALDDREKSVRYKALDAIGRTRDPRATPVLLKLVRGKDPVVRGKAIWALGQIGDERALPVLLDLTGRETPSYIRNSAIYALGSFKHPDVLRALLASLKDDDPVVQRAAASSLGRLGDPAAVPPLLALLSEAGLQLRRTLVHALGQLGSQKAVEPLMAIYDEGDRYLKYSVLLALKSIGDKRSLGLFLRALQEKDRLLVSEAARVLGIWRDERTVLALIRAVDNPAAGNAAMEALRAICREEIPTEPDALRGWWEQNKKRFPEQILPVGKAGRGNHGKRVHGSQEKRSR